MSSKRDLKLDEYNIGKYAYRELHNFCLQYPYKKQRLADLRRPYHSPQITGMPHGNDAGQPTEDNAERAAVLFPWLRNDRAGGATSKLRGL